MMQEAQNINKNMTYLSVASADMHMVKDAIELMVEWRSKFERPKKKPFSAFDQALGRYTSIKERVKSASGALGKGVSKFVEQLGPVGAFTVGVLGEDRISSWLASFLTKPDLDFYLSGLDYLTKGFVTGLNNQSHLARPALFLDTYEMASKEIDIWLRSLLGSDLSSQVLFVIAGRDRLAKIGQEWDDWTTVIREIELEPFSDAEAGEYLQLYGITNLQMIEEVTQFSGNLPWALELTVEAFGERLKEDLDRVGRAKRAEFHEIEHQIVLRFLRQLRENETLERLINVCAVLRYFNEDILEFILKENVTQGLQALQRYSFMKVRDDGQWMVHDVVREFIELELRSHAPNRWRDIHRMAADYHKEQLSQHPLYTPEWQQHTLEWLYHAVVVNEAETMRVLAELCIALLSAHLPEYCGSLISTIEGRIKAPESQATVIYYSGQIRLGRGELAAARALMEQLTPLEKAIPQLKLSAYGTLCDILHRQGELEVCIQVAQEGLQFATKLDQPEFICLLAAKMGEIYASQGLLEESRKHCSISERSLELVKDPYLASQVHTLLADTYTFRGDYNSGERNLQAALKLAQSVSNSLSKARISASLGWLYSLVGKWEQGLRACEEVYTFFNKYQDIYHVGLAALNIAKFYRLRGQPSPAIDWNQKAIGAFREAGSLTYEGIALMQLGQAYLDNGEIERAITSLENALEIEQYQVRELYVVGLVLLYLAIAFERKGQQTVAQQNFERSEATLSTAPNRYGYALLIIINCTRALVTNKLDEFLSSLLVAESIAKEWSYMDLQASIERLKGVYALKLYAPKRGKEPDTQILQDIEEKFTLALQIAISYNRYLLDREMQEIRSAIQQYVATTLHPEDGEWLLDQITDFWQQKQATTAQSLSDIERENRSLEVGDAHLQLPLLKQVELLRSSLLNGD